MEHGGFHDGCIGSRWSRAARCKLLQNSHRNLIEPYFVTCPFCTLPAERIVAGDDLAFVIRDGYPISRGHSLIIPRRHVSSFFELTLEEQESMLNQLTQCRIDLQQELSPDGFNVGINDGAAAGQTVMHVHMHLIPRYAGDVSDPRGGIRWVLPRAADYWSPKGGARRSTDTVGDSPAPPYVFTGNDPGLQTTSGAQLLAGPIDPLAKVLREELAGATAAYLAVSFVMRSGVRLLENNLAAALARGARIRILTTDYLGITEPDALRALLRLPGDIRIRLYSEPGRSFHPKAYLFEHGDRGQGSIYVGSSNLSHSALEDGVEWSAGIGDASNSAIFSDFRTQFDRLFESRFAADVTPAFIDEYEARRQITTLVDAEASRPTEIEPRPAQREALAQLRLFREEQSTRALVIAATGIGKTYLAAFDSTEFPRVLFVAHRSELLRQAEAAFKTVRPTASTGFLTSDRRDYSAQLLFASVATLCRPEDLAHFSRDAFDYIVVDEFHHAAADTWRRVLDHFQPRFLLGLTATPYRTDNRDLFALCDDNVAYRVTLFEAIGFGWLCPFHYYGIGDTVDYAQVAWRNGRYDEADLTRALAEDERAQSILTEYQKRRPCKALGFCASIEHAEFMADHFLRHGISALAVHSGPTSLTSREAIRELETGSVEILFTVDMFNEGVDIPALDLVLFLRPTESPTVFLQQLGRGLRLADGKTHLTALDFIGNYRKVEFKLPLLAGADDPAVAQTEDRSKYKAAALLRAYQERRFGDLLPEDCTIDFDLRAVDLLRSAIAQQEPVRQRLIAGLEQLATDLGRRPTMLEAERHCLYPVHQYRTVFGSWMQALAACNLLDDRLARIEAQTGTFLREIERTAMTKSYKMAVLRIWLDAGTFPLPLAVDDLVYGWRDFFGQLTFRRDLRGTEIQSIEEVTDGALREYIARNPLHFWSQGDFFEITPNRLQFRYVGPIGEDATSFLDAVRERVEWRLYRYFERRFERKNVYRLIPNGTDKVCIMIGNDPAEDTPVGSGWQVVIIDGQRFYAKFAKKAINVLKPSPTDDDTVPNQLTSVLASLFHCSVEQLPGKSVRLTRHSLDDAWLIEAGARPGWTAG